MKKIRAYRFVSSLALTGSVLKLIKTANIFDKKMLKAGKTPPLAIANKIPSKKRQH